MDSIPAHLWQISLQHRINQRVNHSPHAAAKAARLRSVLHHDRNPPGVTASCTTDPIMASCQGTAKFAPCGEGALP